MTEPDVTAAIAYYLRDQIGDRVGDLIFRPELDLDAIRQAGLSMPTACIVVRPAGGYVRYGSSYQDLGDPRVDCLCYGSTRLEADNIGRAVLRALRSLIRRVYGPIGEKVLLHGANISGVMPLVDPSEAWPYTLVSAQVLIGEQTLI